MKKIFSIIFIVFIIFSLSVPAFANNGWPTDANQTQEEDQEPKIQANLIKRMKTN